MDAAGASIVLAVYCLAAIDITAPSHALPEVAGVAVTVATYGWWRYAVLSIVTGTL